MTMPYWMHWFWITFIVTLSAEISTSLLSLSNYKKQAVLTLLDSNSSTTVDYDDLDDRNRTLSLTERQSSKEDVRIAKAIDVNVSSRVRHAQIEQTLTIYGNNGIHNNSLDYHNNKTYLLQNKKDLYENSSNDKNKIKNSSDINGSYIKVKQVIGDHSNLVVSNISAQALNITNIENMLNTTEHLLLINDQKRKELVIEDISTEEKSSEAVQSASGVDDQRLIESSEQQVNVATIICCVFGVLVFVTSVGAVTFLLYRRRYLNKPHSLNDKCSNLDSSGYIDDNTIRENSEEMYSLDNDSFLNSLEAMTIQNYWTDHVKHTKL